MVAHKGIRIKHFVVILILLWTGLAAASLWWNMVHLKDEILKAARRGSH